MSNSQVRHQTSCLQLFIKVIAALSLTTIYEAIMSRKRPITVYEQVLSKYYQMSFNNIDVIRFLTVNLNSLFPI